MRDTELTDKPTRAADQLTVLIIDDEAMIRRVLRAYLEKLNYRVIEAEDGEAGVELFRWEKPDVVLVDMLIPKMDGLTVLDILNRKAPDIPLIVVSGTGMITDVIEAMHLGVWDYILKPICDMGMLDHSIRSVLERSRLIRENKRYQEQLEEKIQIRTAELETVVSELKIRNEGLERFSYTVSHDLKTPLITIKGFLGKLTTDIQAEDHEAISRNICILDGAAGQMYKLLNELL